MSKRRPVAPPAPTATATQGPADTTTVVTDPPADDQGQDDGPDDEGAETQGAGDQPPTPPQRQAPPAPPVDQRATKAAEPAKPKVVPEVNGNSAPAAIQLLQEACEIYGVNPNPELKPRELLSWRYYPETDREPARVVIVTAGGQKLGCYEDPDFPLDPDTEETLRNIFGAWTLDGNKNRVPGPLPDDFTLPRAAVTGTSDATDHQYKGGYLKSGGRKEGDKRTAARRR